MIPIRLSVHRPCLNTKVAVQPIEWLRSRLAGIFQCVRRLSQRHRPVCQVESVIFFGLWSRPVVSRDSSSCSRRTTNSWAVTEQSNGCLSSFVVVVDLKRVCWVFAINNVDPRFRKWKARDRRGRLSFVSYYRKRSYSSHDEEICKMNMRMVNATTTSGIDIARGLCVWIALIM